MKWRVLGTKEGDEKMNRSLRDEIREIKLDTLQIRSLLNAQSLGRTPILSENDIAVGKMWSADKAKESSQQDKELDAKDTFTYRYIANEKYLKGERYVPYSEFELLRWIITGDISQLNKWKIISSILIAVNSLLIVAIIFVIFINAWR